MSRSPPLVALPSWPLVLVNVGHRCCFCLSISWTESWACLYVHVESWEHDWWQQYENNWLSLRVALFNTLLCAGGRGHRSAFGGASVSVMLRPGWRLNVGCTVIASCESGNQAFLHPSFKTAYLQFVHEINVISCSDHQDFVQIIRDFKEYA